MPSLVKAALLGTLQGLTEFLPISSTAHLIIAGRLLQYDDPGGVFKLMIQLGSILAVMWLYRVRILSVIGRLATSPVARRTLARMKSEDLFRRTAPDLESPSYWDSGFGLGIRGC